MGQSRSITHTFASYHAHSGTPSPCTLVPFWLCGHFGTTTTTTMSILCHPLADMFQIHVRFILNTTTQKHHSFTSNCLCRYRANARQEPNINGIQNKTKTHGIHIRRQRSRVASGAMVVSKYRKRGGHTGQIINLFQLFGYTN